MALHRYWFTFENLPPMSALALGCGVTAHDREDALKILKTTVFLDGEFPTIVGLVDDVDVNSLDRGHVIPNMGSPVGRGVWFPLGY